MEKTKSISPNSLMKFNVCGSTVKPICPAAIPTNSIHVTPKDMPFTFTLPRSMPSVMTNETTMTVWAIPSPVNRVYNHSMTES